MTRKVVLDASAVLAYLQVLYFDKLNTNGKLLIPFVLSRELIERSNHEWNQLVI